MKIKKTAIFMIIITGMIILSGCSVLTNRMIIYDDGELVGEKLPPAEDGDFFLAVAVSGGGSRSAVWSAAVLKELFYQVKLPDGRSIIDEIDYISSVSGGSLSSAYYCLNKPESDTRDVEEYQEFFDNYLTDMRRNIESDILLKPWLWYRILVLPEEKAFFLKWDFEKFYFGDSTFGDLYERQKRGYCPTLIINGTVMDNGAKFLFTTLSRKDFNYLPNFETERFEDTGIIKSNILFEEGILDVLFCEDIGLSIEDMDVSRAVVASAGVPLIFGPIILRDEVRSCVDDDYYIHVNDGGVGDTLGLESIVQLLLTHFDDPNKNYRGGMVIIIDANIRIDPEDSVTKIRGLKPVDTIERSRVIYAYRGKTLAYYAIMFIQQDPRFKDIKFVYISPYLADDPELIKEISDNPVGFSFEPKELDVLIEKFKSTPTRFKIKKELANNIEKAAKIVVEEVKERILLNFEGKDLPQ